MLYKNKGLVVGLTDKCNLHCAHCLRHVSENRSEDLSLALFEKILLEAKLLGIRHISLTGGEAGLHHSFNQVADLIVKHGLTFSLVTNGNDPKIYNYITNTYKSKVLTFIAVSIDGASSETYQRVRGGDFQTACRSLYMFSQKGYYTKLVYCVNRANYHEFDGIVRLALALHVPEVVVLGLINFDHNSGLSISSAERNSIIDQSILVNKNYKNIKITWTASLGEMNQKPPVIDFCSNAMGFYPFIRANGDCEFCCDAEGTILGSLKDLSLFQIAQKHLEFSNYMRMDRYRKIEKEFENISTCNYCIAAFKSYHKMFTDKHI